MKVFIIIFISAITIFQISCSKSHQEEMVGPGSTINVLSTINNTWELYMYVIGTDNGYYYLTGQELKNHSLFTLKFHTNRNYMAADPQWSGVYSFLSDSAYLILEPSTPYILICNLHIDNISQKQMQVSSPWVQVNPEQINASNYERLIAYQVLTYMTDHQKDFSKLKTVKVALRYFAK